MNARYRGSQGERGERDWVRALGSEEGEGEGVCVSKCELRQQG